MNFTASRISPSVAPWSLLRLRFCGYNLADANQAQVFPSCFYVRRLAPACPLLRHEHRTAHQDASAIPSLHLLLRKCGPYSRFCDHLAATMGYFCGCWLVSTSSLLRLALHRCDCTRSLMLQLFNQGQTTFAHRPNGIRGPEAQSKCTNKFEIIKRTRLHPRNAEY